MRRSKGWGAATVMLGLTLAWLLVSRPAQAQNAIPLFSGNNWTTYAANPLPGTPPPPALGPARAVCLNPGNPLFCGVSVGGVPPVFYGYPGNGWSAKTSMAGICGKANWVWAPGVKGPTPHASLATYYFSRTVLLTMPPTAPATLSVAVDDYAEVWSTAPSSPRWEAPPFPRWLAPPRTRFTPSTSPPSCCGAPTSSPSRPRTATLAWRDARAIPSAAPISRTRRA